MPSPGSAHAARAGAVGRRGLLGAAVAGTALALVPDGFADAAPRGTAKKHAVPVEVPRDHALHALRRLGYGPTPDDLAAVRRVGVDSWLNQQLAGGPDPHDAQLALMFPLLSLSPLLMAEAYADAPYNGVQAYEWATLSRAIYSGHQVLGRLTEVWLDHFNVSTLVDKISLPWTRIAYDTKAIRPRAAGRFVDLLEAVLVSPAMLAYLDQWISNKEYPVENLARENLELHTVGLGNFTERDVKAYAKLLTGCTINPATWEYEYNPGLHWTGHLEILGFKASNRSSNGEHLVRSFAEYLAHRPATARNVARRLLVHYVSDRPSAHLIERVAKHYLHSHTDIGSTLRYIVEQPEFFASRGTKTRRPGDTFVAGVRGLGWTWPQLPDLGTVTSGAIGDWGAYLYFLRAAGHAPGEWPAPNGYPQVGAAWLNSNTMLQTWQLLGWTTDFGTPGPFGKSGGPAANAWHPGITVDGIIEGAAHRITGQSMRREHRHVVAAIAGLEPSAKPPASWRQGTSTAHSAIHFAIVASEYMAVR